jgi:hypothetical protein
MAIHNSAVLLAGNRAVRDANRRRGCKKHARRDTVAMEGSLTIKEGQDTVTEGLVQ